LQGESLHDKRHQHQQWPCILDSIYGSSLAGSCSEKEEFGYGHECFKNQKHAEMYHVAGIRIATCRLGKRRPIDVSVLKLNVQCRSSRMERHPGVASKSLQKLGSVGVSQ
jgi:hypothetical protein